MGTGRKLDGLKLGVGRETHHGNTRTFLETSRE